MDNEPVSETRRTNMLLLIDEIGSIKDFSERCNTNANYISQIKTRHKNRSLGTRLARKIEKALKKPIGWMDVPHPKSANIFEEEAQTYSAVTPTDTKKTNKKEEKLLEIFRELDPDDQTRLHEVGSALLTAEDILKWDGETDRRKVK